MMLTKFFKTTCQVFLLVLMGVLLFFNGSFHHSPAFAASPEGAYNKDVYQQLQYLKKAMHAGAATEMQQLFPEGFIFMHALYGLTWADLAIPLKKDTAPKLNKIRKEANDEIAFARAAIDSRQGRRIFHQELPLPYGVFYRGWANYLRGKQLQLAEPGPDSLALLAQFREEADAIALAFDRAPGPYLESYHQGTWPADNCLAIASLARYDNQFHSYRYQTTIQNWLVQVKASLDPTTGLVPHSFFPGQAPPGARGSSQSLMLAILPDIDSAFAREQYALYRQHFVDQKFGLPGIREYPRGMAGTGDIDSGPILLGIGGAASVVGQRAALQQADTTLYLGLRNSLEAFGLAYTFAGKKRYLGGQLPMADAFLAWSNAAERPPGVQGHHRPLPWAIHLLSLGVLLLLAWIIRKL